MGKNNINFTLLHIFFIFPAGAFAADIIITKDGPRKNGFFYKIRLAFLVRAWYSINIVNKVR